MYLGGQIYSSISLFAAERKDYVMMTWAALDLFGMMLLVSL